MPTTIGKGKWDSLNNTMQSPNTQNDDNEAETHAERVRQQMDTKDLGAIMGRFYDAVSWGGSR
jgi:hypothetical protein